MFTRINAAFTAVAVAAVLAFGALTATELSGCASTPAETAALTVIVDIAVGQAVQHGTSDPAVMAKRAAQIVLIAGQLKALDAGAIATLPVLTQALQPLLMAAKLNPADMLAANVLIDALSQVIATQVSPTSTQATTIQAALQAVINAASLYVPTAAT